VYPYEKGCDVVIWCHGKNDTKKEETRCNGNYKTTWHRKQQTTCDHVICKELKLNNTTTNEEKKKKLKKCKL
jgi:hypothetical protein